MPIVTLGIDIAKNVFQLHGVDASGAVILRKQLSRKRLLSYLSELSPCLVGMEACGSSHYWGREISCLGHEVRLMPAQYVKPYVKRSKTDAADAAAICEAVTRPDMRFVAIKSADQQAVLLYHRSREILVKQRTMLVNAVRAHMAEFGVVVARGLQNVDKLKTLLDEQAGHLIPSEAQYLLAMLFTQITALNDSIADLDKRIRLWHSKDEACQRLVTIPGIGPLTATAIVASIGDGKLFSSGRSFAAWLGLTPRECSSGGKQKLGGISKQGDGYIRRLLIHGARAVVRMKTRKDAPPSPWLDSLLARKHRNAATVALANKNARMAWVILTREENYQPNKTVDVTA
ncbi:MAG: IS110 family transposase [Thiolinea sp.]